MENKFQNLKEYLKSLNSAAVAFSAGVDSTFLLKAAHNVLYNNVIALSAKSPLLPERELKEAIEFCQSENIKHIIVEIDIENIRQNPKDRCYICKKAIFNKFIEIAKSLGIENILEGSNIDDTNDYRPGMQAVKELNIKSPLMDMGLTKSEIRILSKNLGLKTGSKASFACLASRFAYNEKITDKKLKMVEKAEEVLYQAGFKQFRVRIHGDIARIEILPEDFNILLSDRGYIIDKFKEFGFSYTTLDLGGYKTGSMNKTIKEPEA